MKALTAFLFFVSSLLPGTVSAGYMAGIIVDTSTNMLMRPDGLSGTVKSMYADFAFSRGGTVFSYNVDGGMLDRYDGLQFHHHDFGAAYTVLSKSRFSWDVGLSGELGRYGDVTVLNGYEQYAVSSLVKTYLTPVVLFRWHGEAGHRTYRNFDSENFTQGETILRLDRFFATGTTLRGQIDLGLRRYDGIADDSQTFLYGTRVRVAQSLGARWGVWLEARATDLNNNSSQSVDRMYDRIFLDDRYKYSLYGAEFSSKYILRSSGSIQLAVHASERRYSDTQASSFWYLPPEGWTEREHGISLTLAKRFGFLPRYLHPSIELYYNNVDATVTELSYDSTGVTARFDVF